MKRRHMIPLAMACLLVCSSAEAQTVPHGKHITFNGVDQHLVIANHAHLNIAAGESYTLTLRMRQENFNGVYRIFSKGNLHISGGRYELFTNNTPGVNNFALNLRNQDNTNIGTPYFTTLMAGQWIHFAWVYSAAEQASKVYVDGQLMHTLTNSAIGSKSVENAMDLIIGCGTSNATAPTRTFFWPGQLDELRIWKRALTPADLAADRTAAVAATDHLVAAYDFESISGEVVPDVSGNGHDGQLVGYGVWVYKPDLPAGLGNAGERLAAFRVNADTRTETLTSITLNLDGTTDPADLSNIRVYYNGPVERLNLEDATLFGSAEAGAGVLTITGNQALTEGENYFWITADVSAGAREGHQIGANPLSFTKSGGQPVNIPEVEGTRTLLQTSTLLFSGGDAGSKNYRIPAIVTAMDGSLVTATDKRWDNAADLPNHIDVVIRRSSDHGKTWSNALTIAGLGTNVGYGDPALVVNRQNGDIICLFASHKGWTQSTATDPQRINVSVSSDNGITWSTPVDITSQIYGAECSNPVSKNWPGAFVTSGAATQLRRGRLMAVLAARETSAFVISNFVIYSDDGAQTWKVSTNRASINGDEAKVVELDNGDVLMSIRHNGYRWFNVSRDQGITWLESPYSQPDIIDPFCNGDLVRYTSLTGGYDKNRLLHSIPYATSRKNVSVLISYDEGDTWPLRRTIIPGASAYSSLCVLDDGNGTIGMYVEVGEYETYQMYFMSFSLDWLSGGTDQWNPPAGITDVEQPKGSRFRAFPNPTGDRLNVSGDLKADTVIELYDLRGALLEKMRVAANSDRFSFSIAGFEPGLYLLKIGGESLRFVVDH